MLRQIDDTPARKGLEPAMKHQSLLAQIRRLKVEKDVLKKNVEELEKKVEDLQKSLSKERKKKK